MFYYHLITIKYKEKNLKITANTHTDKAFIYACIGQFFSCHSNLLEI